MKKQQNTAQSNGKKKSPETNPKEKYLYELPDKEFKITIIKMFNKLRKWWINKIRIPKKRKYKNELNRNFGTENYLNKKFTRGVNEHTSSVRRKKSVNQEKSRKINQRIIKKKV